MTKADLIEEVSTLAEVTRKDGEVIVETIFDSIVKSLRAGDKIEIRGFGSFRTRQRKPRIGRNPKPGESTGYNGGTYDAAEPNDPWTPYQDYGHNHWRNSLFYAENKHDFSVLGPGLIHGKGLSHGAKGTRGGYQAFV